MKYVAKLPVPLAELLSSHQIQATLVEKTLSVEAPPEWEGAIAFLLGGYLARAGSATGEFDSVKVGETELTLEAALTSEAFYSSRSKALPHNIDSAGQEDGKAVLAFGGPSTTSVSPLLGTLKKQKENVAQR